MRGPGTRLSALRRLGVCSVVHRVVHCRELRVPALCEEVRLERKVIKCHGLHSMCACQTLLFRLNRFVHRVVLFNGTFQPVNLESLGGYLLT